MNPRGTPPRRFAAPGPGSSDPGAELVRIVKSDERHDAASPHPRPPIRLGDHVRIIDPAQRLGQPAGTVIALDDFPPGRSVCVQPLDGGVFWVRWTHEVEQVPPRP